MQPATLQPAATRRSRFDHAFWRGVWIGLVPLALAIGAVAATLLLATLVRLLFASAGFLVWRWIVAGVWIGSLAITAVIFAYATFRVLRLVATWQREGQFSQASGACWALSGAALIVLLPPLVALVFP